MCGIIGIAQSENVSITDSLGKSLKWLTYRGYDSYGYAIKEGSRIFVHKDTGFVNKKLFITDYKGKIAIGHTRWATHGKPDVRNAHPHTDCTGTIAVVHNGIIDNFIEIKENLIKLDHFFKSETDTEVISHLIEVKLREKIGTGSKDPFLEAFRDAIDELKGTFAVAVIWNNEDKIYTARKVNSLVVGIGDHRNFVSSDIPAFLEYTKKFTPVEDNQIAVVSAENIKIFNRSLKEVEFNIYTCPYDIGSISKGEHSHFMIKEILEQESALEKIFHNRDRMRKAANFFSDKNITRIIFTGSGSSYHACIAGKYLFEKLLGWTSEVILSSEFMPITSNIDNTLFAIVSQSGETLDTYCVAERIFKIRNDANVLFIVNNPYSSIERLINKKEHPNALIIQMEIGVEICVAATKTYTCQIFTLILLAAYIGLIFFPDNDDCRSILKEAESTPKKVREVLVDSQGKINHIAQKYNNLLHNRTIKNRYKTNFYIVGRGINLATAYEGALKIKELSYVPAEGIPGGEMKHGTLAVVDNHTLIFVLFPPSGARELWKSTLNNLREIHAREAPIVTICSGEDLKAEIKLFSSDIFLIPDVDIAFVPIIQIIFFQIFSFNVALLKGLDPDHPRNLAKTVTVE